MGKGGGRGVESLPHPLQYPTGELPAKAVHCTLPRFIGCLRGATTRPALGISSWLHRNGSQASCMPVCYRCGPLEYFKAVLRAEYVE